MIFLRVLPNFFLWPHYSGAPGAWGPRFIEPPEPPVPIRHWYGCTLFEPYTTITRPMVHHSELANLFSS